MGPGGGLPRFGGKGRRPPWPVRFLRGKRKENRLSKVLAVAGKGGVGKTTLAALVIRYLKNQGRNPILAVDADPNANLAEALGLKVERSLGFAREEFFESKLKLPPGMTKD